MPRLTASSPSEESRKALEQRARQATTPASVIEKKHWPFSIADKDAASTADDGGKKPAPRDEHKSD